MTTAKAIAQKPARPLLFMTTLLVAGALLTHMANAEIRQYNPATGKDAPADEVRKAQPRQTPAAGGITMPQSTKPAKAIRPQDIVPDLFKNDTPPDNSIPARNQQASSAEEAETTPLPPLGRVMLFMEPFQAVKLDIMSTMNDWNKNEDMEAIIYTRAMPPEDRDKYMEKFIEDQADEPELDDDNHAIRSGAPDEIFNDVVAQMEALSSVPSQEDRNNALAKKYDVQDYPYFVYVAGKDDIYRFSPRKIGTLQKTIDRRMATRRYQRR